MSRSQPIETWSPLELGAVTMFGFVAILNATRFGLGVEAAAGVAAAVAVLIPRQLGGHFAAVSWYLAPIAMVGLQAKLVGVCAACNPLVGVTTQNPVTTGVVLPASAFVGILALAVLGLLRVSPTVRFAVAAAIFVGQAGLILAVPYLCVACVLATGALAGLAGAEGPPMFAASLAFRRVMAGTAALGVITAILVASGAYPGPPRDLADLDVIPAVGGLKHLGVPDRSLVVIGSPSCPACSVAEAFLRERNLKWPVRYPCGTRRNQECWTYESMSWRLPTLLRREGEGYRVLVRGFSAKEWGAYQ